MTSYKAKHNLPHQLLCSKNYLITSLTSCENLKLIKARVFNPDLALLFIPLCVRARMACLPRAEFPICVPRNAMSQRPRFPLLPLSVHLHAAKRAPPRQGTDFVVPELVHHVKDFTLDKVRTDVKYVVWSFSALIL